ncbi:MAG: hypothetical protein NTX79_03635 [Candidatus Micrarchaeota archaeon]|nr:hypothetical protein [Candidatus Micrarchaeota archaeon]
MKKKETGPPAPQAAHWLAGALSSAYHRVPELPYLDRATSLIMIVCVLGYFGLVAYIFCSTPAVEIEARMLEGSLIKNSALALTQGEEYLYVLESPESAQQVAYSVSLSPSCAGVLVSEQSQQASQILCILKNGMLSGADGGVANANYGNQSILLFSPWMLAASENSSWSVDTVYSAHGVEMNITTHFASKGKTALAGREAYEIEVGDTSGAPPALFFIDAEKRVLLYADLGNVTVKMVSAPFALDWNASAQN